MKGIGKRSDTKKSSRSVIEDNLIRFELRSGARNTVICSALLIILGVIGFCLGIKDAYLAIRIISIISFICRGDDFCFGHNSYDAPQKQSL